MKWTDGQDPLVLPVDEIQEGASEYVLDVTAAGLDLQDAYYTFPAVIHVCLRLHRIMETYTLTGTAQTIARGECCRCLVPVDVPLRAQLQVLFQLKNATPEELEAAAEDGGLVILRPGTRELNLAEHVHDGVLLELPVRVYCRQDCRGLCPHCGTDLNRDNCQCVGREQDPRWEALKNIKFR